MILNFQNDFKIIEKARQLKEMKNLIYRLNKDPQDFNINNIIAIKNKQIFKKLTIFTSLIFEIQCVTRQ